MAARKTSQSSPIGSITDGKRKVLLNPFSLTLSSCPNGFSSKDSFPWQKKKNAFSISQNCQTSMNERSETLQQCSEPAGCVTAVAFTETAETNSMLCAGLETHGSSVLATHDATAWLHCCFHIILFHICLCTDMLDDLRFVWLSRICILSLCHEVILFSLFHLWNIFVSVRDEGSRHQVYWEAAKNRTSSSDQCRMAPKWVIQRQQRQRLLYPDVLDQSERENKLM